eukprot:Gb_10454 [translate_table: standard]
MHYLIPVPLPTVFSLPMSFLPIKILIFIGNFLEENEDPPRNKICSTTDHTSWHFQPNMKPQMLSNELLKVFSPQKRGIEAPTESCRIIYS